MARHATVAVLSLALSTACSTARVVRLDTGQAPPLEHRPLASTPPVMVETGAFEEALARLVLVEPLRLRPPRQGWLVPASHHDTSAEARWLQLMARSYGGPCTPGQRGTTCLSLLDDVLGWDQREKLGIALALSFEPMKASISRAVSETLAPQLFYGILATGLVTWLVLAANPEPVFTKSMAIVSVPLLASRLAMLPRFAQAAAVGASGLGIKLVNVGQVSAVTVVGSTVVISLPAAAVAMTATGAETARGATRVNKVGPHPEAQGPHSSFKRDPTTGKVTGYTEFDAAGNPVKRFRGEGKPHGGEDPPFVLEPKPSKGPGSPPKVPRAPRPDELPKGYDLE